MGGFLRAIRGTLNAQRHSVVGAAYEQLATDTADEVKPADFSAVWQSVNPFGSTR